MAMSDSEAAELLRQVRGGTPIRQLTDRAGSPFSSWRFRKYCRANPAYHREVLAASKANEVAKKSASGQRRFGDKTHCPKGHEYSGENVGMKLSRGRPSRYCKVCSRIAATTVRPMSDEQVEKVKALVNEGVSLHKIAHGGKLHVTGHRNIAHQRSIDPAFDRLIAEANARKRAAATAFMRRRNGIVRAQRQADEYRTILEMTPGHLPADMRNETAQNVVVALLEGSLKRTDIKDRIRSFVTAHNRMFPVNFAKFGPARLVSLDEVLFHDGTRTRGETVSQGLWG